MLTDYDKRLVAHLTVAYIKGAQERALFFVSSSRATSLRKSAYKEERLIAYLYTLALQAAARHLKSVGWKQVRPYDGGNDILLSKVA